MNDVLFDRDRLRLLSLSARRHDMTLADLLPLDAPTPTYQHADLPALTEAISTARAEGREVILLMGAHPIKQGLSRFLIDLLDRGFITLVGMNGACVIHDFELALIGATTESVTRYIKDGRFGNWVETGRINDIVTAEGPSKGLGRAVGEAILKGEFPHKEVSLLAAAARLEIPTTVHLGLGYDIIHQHPNFDPAAAARASYRDFLLLAERLRHLENGVFLCLASAVMAPEVYLKALSMARNVELSEGRPLCHFTTAVFDLRPLDGEPASEPPKSNPSYYFRPYKTILVRTVADGGRSYYFEGDLRASLPALHRLLIA